MKNPLRKAIAAAAVSGAVLCTARIPVSALEADIQNASDPDFQDEEPRIIQNPALGAKCSKESVKEGGYYYMRHRNSILYNTETEEGGYIGPYVMVLCWSQSYPNSVIVYDLNYKFTRRISTKVYDFYEAPDHLDFANWALKWRYSDLEKLTPGWNI
ncbi:MAG: hypothetical protein HUJ54_09195 [Erysipelotrichaceae bacterium]|nr:hypothetical protein [Erysipelotrichaceae bacterium]